MIGAAIIRDMALKNAPDCGITWERVASAALGTGPDAQALQASIQRLADQEAAWFRNDPLHKLSTERVLHTRTQQVQTLNASNLAALATLQFSSEAAAGKAEAQAALLASYQAAIRAIDEMPGTTTERRGLLQALTAQGVAASGDPQFIASELRIAQKAYLEHMMAERLSSYQNPPLERSDDLNLSH